VDGALAAHGPLKLVAVANGRWFGGGMCIAPHAAPDDGLLDVVVVGDVSTPRLVRRLPSVYRGAHLGFPEVTFVRGRRVEAQAEAGAFVPVDLDGESPGRLPAVFDVVPAALRVRC
jgi:diacylglycerol kinase family enzyme